VVAANRRDVPLAEQGHRFLQERTAIDQVPGAHDLVAPESLDLDECILERVQVGVDVTDDGQPHHGLPSVRVPGSPR
jgi:hypothetical protein